MLTLKMIARGETMMKYYMFEEPLKDELTGEKYRCFGVGYGEHRFSDVCLEEAPVREFVRTLNEEQLEPKMCIRDRTWAM